MPEDKSLFFYGAGFHRMFDRPLDESRHVALDLIASGSSVLDIGCGTGVFCVALRRKKDCPAVGLDLSLRMLEFARKNNPFPDMAFVHGDATDLTCYRDRSFDYVTMLHLVHELSRKQQFLVLKEALRVAGRAIIADVRSPLPKNLEGLGLRTVEATFGRDHFANFRAYLAAGGIGGVLGDSGLPLTVEHRAVFSHRCREVVVVSLAR